LSIAVRQPENASLPRIPLFLLVVFAVPWALLIALRPLASGQVWVVLAWLLPTVWTPTIMAIALMRREEMRARVRWHAGAGHWIFLAGVAPVVCSGAAILGARAAGQGAAFTRAGFIPMMVALQLLTGAVGEELGWRGYLLPRLAVAHGEKAAGWMMALLWSFWHVPGFFLPGTPHHDLIPFVPNLLSTTCFGVFVAFVFYRAGQSVLATMAAHLSINIMSGLGGAQLTSTVYWWSLAASYAAVAVAITLAPRPRRVAGPAQEIV
jgi:uncharacterized protein